MRLSQSDVNINHLTNILKQTPQTIYTTRPLPMQHLENSGIGHHQHFHCHSLTIISYTKTFNLHLKQQGSTSYFIQSNNIGQNFKTPSLWLLLSKIDTKFSDSFLRFIHQTLSLVLVRQQSDNGCRYWSVGLIERVDLNKNSKLPDPYHSDICTKHTHQNTYIIHLHAHTYTNT